MENKSSMTALMSASGRAYHTAVAQRPVFADTAAGELMTEEEYRMIAGYILSGMDFFAPEKKEALQAGRTRCAIRCIRRSRPRPSGG